VRNSYGILVDIFGDKASLMSRGISSSSTPRSATICDLYSMLQSIVIVLLSDDSQNLETGDPVTNLLARVAIFGGSNNQETTFLLTNISAPDGRFSINVIFPNIGSYQIITRLMSQSHDISSLASFTVTVPAMQSSNVFGGNYIIWISLLIAIVVGVASFLVLKNTIKADKSQRT
jgi:hypothetical protein